MLENETLSSSGGGSWADLFGTLAGLYVQDRAAERAQPAAYNQYAYNALQGVDQSQTQAIYAAPQGTAAGNAQESKMFLGLSQNQLIMGVVGLAVVYAALK